MGGRRSQRPGALTHTRITWALSPMVPQVPGVTPGSPLCPWCCGHSSRRGARQIPNVAPLASSSSLVHSSQWRNPHGSLKPYTRKVHDAATPHGPHGLIALSGVSPPPCMTPMMAPWPPKSPRCWWRATTPNW